ncbi:MAG: DUF86 domain-containing protein [Parachlamydiaceae bacterium]
MSSRDWKFRIQDILNSIEKIESYISGLTYSQFKTNSLIIDAVVRNIEVIGEASKSIPKSFRSKHPQIPWDQIGAMRNILIHEYFGVDTKIVWNTAKKDLHTLKKQLNNIQNTD